MFLGALVPGSHLKFWASLPVIFFLNFTRCHSERMVGSKKASHSGMELLSDCGRVDSIMAEACCTCHHTLALVAARIRDLRKEHIPNSIRIALCLPVPQKPPHQRRRNHISRQLQCIPHTALEALLVDNSC